jgi:hypothetical protein
MRLNLRMTWGAKRVFVTGYLPIWRGSADAERDLGGILRLAIGLSRLMAREKVCSLTAN